MSAVPEKAAEMPPTWFVDQMPPGYRNRIEEIERLTKELGTMDQFGRLLWQSGVGLNRAVSDAFAALKLEIITPASSEGFFAAKLDAGRRFVVYVSSASDVLQKRSAELADVFKILHEFAQESDRVIVVANCHPDIAPEERDDAATPEALTLLTRLGAILLPAPTLFALWKTSLNDGDRARRYIDRLHEQDGGAAPPLLPTAR